MSKIEVNTVAPQCGTTLTLGESGDTVTLGSGASQSGFGRTGTVDWQTTIKTGDFTAASGEGYFVNTTSGEIDVTLPSSPSAGDIVAVSDYAKTFDSNNCIMLRNGSNIEGAASNLTLDAEGIAMTFVYADATKGWKVVYAGREADRTAPSFVAATGGTITCNGDFKVHTFTGPGTFTVTNAGNACGSNKIDYLVIGGGGGGGGAHDSTTHAGGGGGAGGFRTTFPTPAGTLPVSAQGYPVTVGAGASGQAGNGGGLPNPPGTPSVFAGSSSITSTGGGSGGGGNENPACSSQNAKGGDGGSGGGGGRNGHPNNGGQGGSGNTPPVSPPQGNNGAAGAPNHPGPALGGGGGGAGSAGSGQTNGSGSANSITGSPVTYAEGGEGGNKGPGGAGPAGATNKGGGGNGGSTANGAGGNGGSGVVIITYRFQ